MAREKLPRNQLSRTAKFYRDNPDSDEKHKQTSLKAAKKPARKKKNAETRAYRRANGLEGKGGPDVHHTSNGKLKIMSASKNRRIK
jgi:hypothetical protein